MSCAITGLAGALYAHLAQAVNYESFLVLISITLLLQVVIGGLGSVHGAFFGAIVVVLLPQVIAIASDYLDNTAGIQIAAYPGLDTALFALLILLMVIYEPRGSTASGSRCVPGCSCSSVSQGHVPTHPNLPENGAPTMSLLQVKDLSISFGGVKAVDGVSFDVKPAKSLPGGPQRGR